MSERITDLLITLQTFEDTYKIDSFLFYEYYQNNTHLISNKIDEEKWVKSFEEFMKVVWSN